MGRGARQTRTHGTRFATLLAAMKVADMMKSDPLSCQVYHSLADAARIMETHGCGWLPVVGRHNTVVGVVTDRDICMAAMQRDRRLSAISVVGAMHTNVFSCHPDDELVDAIAKMQNYAVRRLPVLDDAGVLAGVVSLTDLARSAEARRGDIDSALIGHTLAAINEPRSAASPV